MDILLGEDEDVKLTINKDYADRYDSWRQKEELQKLKDKYGSDYEESSSSEEEDEDAKELTADIERDFFRALSCLKEKNPKIYDQNVRFFKSKTPEESIKKEKKKKEDRFYSVGEYQRNIVIEKGGQFSDDEENEKKLKELSNVEQEKAIKEDFKDALKDSESENENDNENWGGLFKKRVKTQEELKNEEEDYRLWLAGEKSKLKNTNEEQELKGLHEFWTDPKLDEGEQFLRDYILNKRYLEKDGKHKIPSYDEIVHDSDSGLSADEETLEKQADFERKYNFRFEEPDPEFIKHYPRTLAYSMRKKDDRRKKHREEVKARKEAEKAQKVEELKRLKKLKKKEIMEKIKKLQEITGNEDMGFQKNDLEDDFDPEEHDKRMSELFDSNYYGTCEDEEKPECPELNDELEIENWDEWVGDQYQVEEDEELHCEDPGFNMDCDYDPKNKLQKELVESSKRHKKRRQSKFAAAVAKEKPVFDPKNKSFEKYVDEYYSLDYEDLIGDLPCRFKYRKVVPNDFGLTVEEILAAPDRELNSWASVKKIMQRRPENVEQYDVKAYKKKAKDFSKKAKCLPSIYGPKSDETDELQEVTPKQDNKSRKRKNQDSEIEFKKEIENNVESSPKAKKQKPSKHTKKNSTTEPVAPQNAIHGSFENPNTDNKRNLKKEHKKYRNGVQSNFNKDEKKITKNKLNNSSQNIIYGISDERLKSYGLNPKKLKNKLKYGKNS